MNHRLVEVDLGERSYAVHIGRGLLDRVAEFMPLSLDGRAVFILTDENARPHARRVEAKLEADGFFVIPPGEGSKTLPWYEKVAGWLLESGADRRSILVSVGGGVVGDLGGFVAATLLRGISCIQIPTTLLAQVDSSVGGKTAIDMPQGKNLIGAFHQPVMVLCDPDTLKTLPARECRAGYAEILKYGLIRDAAFFAWLEKNGRAVHAVEEGAVEYAIEESCRIKAEIVGEDEHDRGTRALLNFGHTFAHALEVSSGYSGALLHGEAVSIGMVLALKLSARLGDLSGLDIDRVERHLRDSGLPTRLGDLQGVINHDARGLVDLMRTDKKAEGGDLTFILLREIGRAFVAKRVPEHDVRAVLCEFD